MFVPVPKGHDEGIAFVPMKGLTVDHSSAAAAKRVIENRVRMTMRLGALSRFEHLDPTGKCWQGRAPGQWIHVFHGIAFIGMRRALSQPLQRRVNVAPAIVEWGTRLVVFGGDRTSQAVGGGVIRVMARWYSLFRGKARRKLLAMTG